jgi:hypothetical protein
VITDECGSARHLASAGERFRRGRGPEPTVRGPGLPRPPGPAARRFRDEQPGELAAMLTTGAGVLAVKSAGSPGLCHRAAGLPIKVNGDSE